MPAKSEAILTALVATRAQSESCVSPTLFTAFYTTLMFDCYLSSHVIYVIASAAIDDVGKDERRFMALAAIK